MALSILNMFSIIETLFHTVFLLIQQSWVPKGIGKNIKWVQWTCCNLSVHSHYFSGDIWNQRRSLQGSASSGCATFPALSWVPLPLYLSYRHVGFLSSFHCVLSSFRPFHMLFPLFGMLFPCLSLHPYLHQAFLNLQISAFMPLVRGGLPHPPAKARSLCRIYFLIAACGFPS